METRDMAGGVVVITGAASGIGEAMARYTDDKLGMKVVLAERLAWMWKAHSTSTR